MIIYSKLLIILPLILLVSCEQINLVCEKEVRKVAALEQKLASRLPPPPAKSNDAALMKQLEQVTTDLVKVKIQRDLFKQELAAYRKRKLKN